MRGLVTSVGLALVLTATDVAAQAVTYTADCAKLDLTSASGIPAMRTHTYRFGGTCRVIRHMGGAAMPVQTFSASAFAQWDADSGVYHEVFRIVSGVVLTSNTLKQQVVTGKVTSHFACNSDPLITRTRCRGILHLNPTGWDSLSAWYRAGRPMLRGLTTPAEATAMSPLVAPPQSGQPARAAAATPKPTPGPLPRTPGAAAELADGTTLRYRAMGREQRWVVEDANGTVVRVFPASATAAVDRTGAVRITVGREVMPVGTLRRGAP